jgi:uncharacterized protein (TIGR04141 family)
MSGDGRKTWQLTVRLLKAGLDVEQSLKQGHSLKECDWTAEEGLRLFAGTAYAGEAKWKRLLAEGAAKLGGLRNSGAAALLFVPAGGRLMAATFGMAHIFLEPDSFERDFGLKVVLNSVEPRSLRSVDVRTPEEMTVHKRVQTSRNAAAAAFGIDVERDILRSVHGVPRDEEFGSQVNGADSLAITSKLSAADIPAKCAKILWYYGRSGYKKAGFEWVDHIRSVRDPGLVETLDTRLYAAIESSRKSGSPAGLHLAPPEIVEYADFPAVKYTGFRSREEFHAIDAADYVAELRRLSVKPTLDDIKRKHRVSQRLPGGGFADKWKLYDCLVFEAGYKGRFYVLSAGQWYEVSKTFAEQVRKDLDAIPVGPALPDAQPDDNEEVYNDRLAASAPNLIGLHPAQIKGAGWLSGMGPCDFFSAKREFLHIKDEARSSRLSHLFQQGVNSAEAYFTDAAYRRAFKELVAKKNAAAAAELPGSEQRPRTEEFTVAFAVIRKPLKDGSMRLPFFSQVSLRNAAHHLLRAYGYKVAFSWVRKAAAEHGGAAEKKAA